MKKLLIIALALVTIQVSAQKKGERKGKLTNYTPEQIAQLQTKKMTLVLDLTDTQQREIGAINLENAKSRKAKMEARKKSEKPSEEEMFKMKNERLDAQITNKKKMRSILNAEQYKKWEKLLERRQYMKGKRKMKKRDGKSKLERQKE